MVKVLLIFFVISTIQLQGQNISFTKVMNYFISQDPDYIKNDLKTKKYIIQKERRADTEFFDTEIDCYKSPDGKYTSLTGVIIFKNSGKFIAVNYFTLSRADFNKKLQEIRNRGFELITEDTTSQWIYQKEDTLVTAEKRIIQVSNKDYLRYEIGIIQNPNFESVSVWGDDGTFSSKNHFKLKIPSGWLNLSERDIQAHKKAADEFSDTNVVSNMNIEVLATIRGSESVEALPKMYVTFYPQADLENIGFKKSVEIMLSDKVIGSVSKIIGELLPDGTFNFNPGKPLIDEKRRLMIHTIKTNFQGNNTVLTVGCNFLMRHGFVNINFCCYENDLKQYTKAIKETILSFEVEPNYKLIKN